MSAGTWGRACLSASPETYIRRTNCGVSTVLREQARPHHVLVGSKIGPPGSSLFGVDLREYLLICQSVGMCFTIERTDWLAGETARNPVAS